MEPNLAENKYAPTSLACITLKIFKGKAWSKQTPCISSCACHSGSYPQHFSCCPLSALPESVPSAHWLHSQGCWTRIALILQGTAPFLPPVPFSSIYRFQDVTSRLHKCPKKATVAEFAPGECTVATGRLPATARDEWVFSAALTSPDLTLMSWVTDFFNSLVVVRD